MSAARVVVIGGGLAGITAALDCAQAGAEVALVEVRRQLGGAAYSFERDGLTLDNGQHVFLRCCPAYRGLLRRLGSEPLVSLQPRLRIPVLEPGAEPVLLRRSSLPAPLHLAGALARYRRMSVRQRLGAARAALALLAAPPGTAREIELDAVTFGEWLARHGQGADAVAALWDLIALPTLNLPASQASLALSAFVFRTGLLADTTAGDIGFHAASLADTIGAPAARALRRAGVEVRLGWRAQGLRAGGDGIRVQGLTGTGEQDGEPPSGAQEELAAAAVVLAVPHARAAALLEPLAPAAAARIARMRSSPIVNLHVLYDRPVCDEPFAAAVRSPVQYVFDRTAAAGAPAGSQLLAVSLSGADEQMRMSADALRERYLAALAQLLPRARTARVERFVVTREHAATFRAEPGVAALRPGPRTPVPALMLAGAWTATGWPATLEGAVMSGHAAARAALERLAATRPTAAAPPAAGVPAP